MRSTLPWNIISNESGAWMRSIIDLVYPRVCLLCHKPVVAAHCESLCDRCRKGLTPIEAGCERCGAPMPIHAGRLLKKNCFYCKNRKWALRRIYCYTSYVGVASQVARKIKQSTSESLTIEIGKCVGDWLELKSDFHASQYDYAIAVPQHWLRRIRMRYNQAEVLTENIARVLSIPMLRNGFYRTRWTEKQGTKSVAERLTSVDDSFGYRGRVSLEGKRILLVDDIVTSGATVNDASRALKQAGAKRIDVAAFARGVGAVRKTRQSPPVKEPRDG